MAVPDLPALGVGSSHRTSGPMRPASPGALSVLSTTGTPKGQRSSQSPHPASSAIRSVGGQRDGHTLSIDSVDRNLAGAVLAGAESSDAPMCATHLTVLEGTMARAPANESALAHRGGRIVASVGGPGRRERRVEAGATPSRTGLVGAGSPCRQSSGHSTSPVSEGRAREIPSLPSGARSTPSTRSRWSPP
jgi:hypothetical protein